ncbi:MAG: hypothetical protein IJ463_01320 [Bacilli bacterium]|nr:hypothetical protein [Bacilli bacterium]
MKCFRLNSATIVFDETTKDKAIELKSIIEKNELLFLEVQGKNKIYSFIKDIPNTEYIEDVDAFFRQLVEESFYSKNIEEKLNDQNQTLTVYLGYLIVEGLSRNQLEELYSSEKSIEETVKTLGESLYQKEIYEDILIKEYFDEFGSKEDFINYLKTKNNTQEIIAKIKNKYRFKAYNKVLQNIVEYLESCGYFYPENMLEICGNIHFEMRELTFSKVIDLEDYEARLSLLPKMNKLTLDKYFREFLKEIDPEGLLLRMYNEALLKRKIKFSKNYKGSFCVINEKDASLEIKDTGTIKDFFTLSHEFMHYVLNTYNKNSIPLALEEFPSIFFEKYAIDFLIRKGYSENQLEVLHDFRLNDLKEKSFGVLNFLVADIIQKQKGEEVDDSRLREYVMVLNKFVKKRNKELIEQYGPKEDGTPYLEPYNVEEYINDDIDNRTKSYFVGLVEYVEAFRYPISAFIAFKTYDKFKNDESVLPKMIDYMLYASNPTFKDTIEQFGISDKYQELLEYIEKERQKVLNKNNM